jgi:competence protein ComEC
MKVDVLPIGQDDENSYVLHDRGHVLFIDPGRKAKMIAACVLPKEKVDGIILTHMDADHAGGLSNLLTRVDTDLILLPAEASENVENLRTRTGGLIQTVGEYMILRFETGEIRIFASSGGDNSNENSLCILFDTEKCDILVTGDRSEFGEWLLMTSNELPKVDILIAGHHGSKYSTSKELLETVQPEIVMISAGKDNRYGHPAPELLKRLQDFGCIIYRTDENGTIQYRR